MLVENITNSRQIVSDLNPILIDALKFYLSNYSKHIKLWNILVNTHVTQVYHVTGCLDLTNLETKNLVIKINLSSIKDKNYLLKRHVVMVERDSFFHNMSLNQWSNFKRKSELPDFLKHYTRDSYK
jgi:hypothetical protein